jgi:hypothetical protein
MALASPAQPACPGGELEKLLSLVPKGRPAPLGPSGLPCQFYVTVTVEGLSLQFVALSHDGSPGHGIHGVEPFIPCNTKATSTHMRSPLKAAAPRSSIHGAFWAQEGGTILAAGIFQPCCCSVRRPGSNEADQASRMSSIGCEEFYTALNTAPSGTTPWVT